MGKQIIINVCISIVYFLSNYKFQHVGLWLVFKKRKRRKEIVKVSEYMPTSKYAKLCFYFSTCELEFYLQNYYHIQGHKDLLFSLFFKSLIIVALTFWLVIVSELSFMYGVR